MKQSKGIIEENKIDFEHFDYYHKVISTIESNLEASPDISIESCKSFLEGIAKTVILKLDLSESYKAQNKSLDKMEFMPLLKHCLTLLSQAYDEFDEDFVRRAGGWFQRLAEMRNMAGDISHGKSAPKQHNSSVELAQFAVNMTDAIGLYILSHFFKTDTDMKYEDNEEFNLFLDEQFELEGKIRYSRAVYDQDYISYENQLDAYLADMEIE